MKKSAIVILTHKNELNEYEWISLNSLLHVYGGSKDIFIAVPETLDTDVYEAEGIKIVRFADVWFSNYRKYNELCLQTFLYQQFVDYEYLLFYQLDGFAFYDNLDYFCNLGYDYIGAPWEYGNFWYKNQYETIWYVGCGGVSLRKVSAFIEFTQCEEIKKMAAYEQEDMLIVSSYEMLKIAPISVAKKFCVTEFFDSVTDELPMLLHWFDHMDEPSYRKAIESQGYCLPDKGLYQFEWDKSQRLEMVEYWKSEFNLETVKRRFDEALGRKIDECYVWGTGNNALLITRMFSELGIDIKAYIDNDEKKRNVPFGDKNVFRLDDLSDASQIFIFVSPSKAESIEEQLTCKNCVKYNDYIIWKDFVRITGLDKGGMR